MLIEAFAEQVSRNPRNIAVRTRENEISYELLDRQSDDIAGRITGSRGALLFEHGADMIAATLGALKANMVYIPFDPDYPENRLVYMLEDSEAGLIITNTGNYPLAVKLAAQVGRSIEILNIDEPGAGGVDKYTYKEPGEDQIAYILYTSGSTGKPKGVVQTHRNVLHFARSYINRLGLNETDRLTLFSSFSHDAAVVDIFGGLLCGATLYPLSARQQITVEELPRWLAEEELTVWHSVPTLYRFFVNMPKGTEDYPKLRYVVLGGENVLQQDVLKCRVVFKNAVLVNLYGQSESSINSMQFVPPDEEFEDVNLGEPIDGVKVVILNKNGEIAEPLREGEIVVASEYLAREYWKDEEKTAKAFTDHAQLGRIYRTGDMGFYTIDRKIEYSGRKDFQVKIRGFRVELEEIENCLLKHELVKEAAVIGKEDTGGGKVLHAYIAADGALTAADIRNYLLKELPEYMMPSYFTMLERLPLTPTGKTDRKALLDIKDTRTKEYAAPTNDLERKFEDIWRDILGIEKIGINESFFELGGHSLKAISLTARIYKELGIEVPLRELFANPTIKQLAEYIGGQEESPYQGIEKIEDREYYQLSSAQKRMYTLQQFDLKSTAYNMPQVLEIEGELDMARVEQAFNKLIQRHETLRTSFMLEGDDVVQKVHQAVEIQIEYKQLDGKEEIDAIIKTFVRPFDLSSAPLLRVMLVKLPSRPAELQQQHTLLHGPADKMENRQLVPKQRHLLLFDMHHIISDGTSMAILVGEFVKLYEGKEPGALSIQYRDYAAWQNRIVNSDVMEKQEKYWLKSFEGELPVLDMPTDYPRPAIQSYEGDMYGFKLEEALFSQLKALAAKNETTLFMVLLEILSIVLSKYSAQEDIIIGTVSAGRSNEQTQSLIGLFLNSIAIRCMPSKEKSAASYLRELRETVLHAYENQDYPIEELTRKLDIRKDMGRNMLFDVMLILQNYERQSLQALSGQLEIKPYPWGNKVSDYDMSLFAAENGKELLIGVQYCTRLFRKETIERFAAHFCRVASEIVMEPERQLSDISMLESGEKNKTIYQFNNSKIAYPKEKTLHQLFEEQVEKTPDNIAAVYEEKSLTYRALNEQANKLAGFLKERGVKQNSIIGIMTEKSAEMLAGILAVLKAGGAYLPIDPAYPPERINYMLEDSGVKLLLVQGKLKEKIDAPIEKLILENEAIYTGSGENPERTSSSDSLAYIIYTSGTTGKPKGIMTEHRNVIAYVTAFNSMFGLTEKDATLQQASITFDGFVEETYSMLTCGGKIVIPRDEQVKEARELKEIIDKNGVTILSCSPLILSEFNKLEPMETVHTFLSSSDILKKDYYTNIIKNAKVYNMYGPSEATVCSTCYACTGEEADRVPIGKPIANYRVYILDEKHRPQPVGVSGEIYISGAGISRGYINKAELSGERFLADPFVEGERMYRTGDMARWQEDGSIEFLGRKDQQVKIRGYRIEVGEIESMLLKHEAIKEAVVVVREDERQEKYLAAYMTADKEMTVGEIREHLKTGLPEYMLPQYYVMLDKLPLTPNGKIDRRALPEPGVNINTGAEYEAPGNETEEKLVRIWQEILKVANIGINDNFFELGGHSLKAAAMVSRLHKELDVEVPLREVFRLNTIKELAGYVKGMQKSIYEAIEPVEHKEYYALSSAQKRLYILNQLEGAETSYNMPVAMNVEGPIDRERLEKAFNELIKRHETLRTSFETVDGEPVQRIHEDVRIQIEYQGDMPSTDEMPPAEEAVEGIIKEFIRPFDLTKAPLMRVKLVKLPYRPADKMENRQGLPNQQHPLLNHQHLLMIDIHHIIADGVSLGILTDEFVKLYTGGQLPQLRIQYKDYSEWQQGALNTEALKKQEEYWLEQLSGELPVLNMPADHPRPSVQSFEGSRIAFVLEPEYMDKLKQLGRKTGATLYMILLAAYNVLLSKYTGQEDIIIGSPIADRPHADLENIIGMFVNTLAMRNYPAQGKSFMEFLQEVKDNALKAYENQNYQFEELVERLNIHRDISRNPLFDVMFSLQNMETGKLEIDNMSFEPYRMESNIAKFDMTLTAMEDKDKIVFSLEYCTRLFERDTIQRFAVHYINVMKSILENPNEKLADIDILTEEEKNKLLYEFNDTETEYRADKTIHQLFEEQVERTPGNTAVLYKDKQLTYKELNEKSNQLARVLRAKGTGPDSIVGIMVKRSPQMLVGLMGILKAGGAYLPIDPEYPEDRINYMLEDSGAKILLTRNNLTAHMNTSAETIDIDDDSGFIGASDNLEPISRPGNLAYVIYTSGSTGKPKGVMIEHRAVCNFIKGMTDRIGFAPDKTILALTTISFDIFVLETLLPLSAGLRILIADEDQQRDPAMLSKLLLENDVDMLQITPSRLQMLSGDDGNPACLEKLREIMIGGEQLPEKLFEAARCLTAASIYNMYGPTETTVWSSMKKLSEGEKVTIGSPIANTWVYIIDSNGKLQPIGVAGELCIGGAGLARGYLGRPELTAEKFVDNPFRPGTKMYKTGDLARWLPDGNIEFLGRVDHQVKIRGFRIELGEIENRLLEYEAVREAVAAAREDESGDKYLCAYIVGDGELAAKELREYLLRELPEYMIPSYFMQLEKLPLTPNGKIDRRALPKPDGSMAARAEYEAPRNEAEQKLVEIWSEVLKADRIGINDNFFELGGHSLRATSMLAKIHKELQVEVPLGQVFKTPTVKGLAEYIMTSEAGAYANRDDKLVLLKKGRDMDKHIFLIHAGSGEVGAYNRFCSCMSNTYNYWGVRAEELEDYCPKNITLEDIAGRHIKRIQNIQPHGPYHLAGWCVGGYIAFEITRQLERMGETVEFMAFFNSYAPSLYRKVLDTVNRFSVKTEVKLISEIITDSEAKRKLEAMTEMRQVWAFALDYLEENNVDTQLVKAKLNEIEEKQYPNYSQLDTGQFIYYTNLLRTLFRAHNLYIPRSKVKAQVYYFIASRTRRKNIQKWQDFCYSPVKYYEVEADHYSIFETQDAEKLSELFGKALLGE